MDRQTSKGAPWAFMSLAAAFSKRIEKLDIMMTLEFLLKARLDKVGQDWICSPGLHSDAWSDLCNEAGLHQPKELRHYYELIQKLLMRMDGEKLSPKVLGLKNKIGVGL